MSTTHEGAEKKFSPPLFLFTVAWSLALIAFIDWVLAYCLPTAFGFEPVYWNAQWNSTLGRFALVFLIAQLANCGFEWFFHRYVLHAPLVPGFSYLFVQHDRRHHMLTNVFIPATAGNRAWKSFYAIIHERQFKASYFPWFSLLAFAGVVTIPVVVIQLLLPSWPIVTAVVLSLAWSLTVYEIVHMIQHWPDSFWKRIIRRFGRLGEILFSYHCEHHAHMHHSNENISGFLFGLPLADLFMGTLKLPKVPFFTGAPVIPADETTPTPRFRLVRWLDCKAEAARERYNQRLNASRQTQQEMLEVV